MNITVSAYNRPEYLESTLNAITRMIGFRSSTVAVLLDPSESTDECLKVCDRASVRSIVLTQHAGCNDAIYTCMRYGFEFMGSDFHLHFEDDTVPTRDALLWFSWARDKYRNDPTVFSVTGYQKQSNGVLSECGLRRWFTPWGWGTWVDRWAEIRDRWSHGDGMSWDVHITTMLRGTRWEAFPTVSRIQNIGAEKGTHVPSASWHAENHHVPVTSDDLGGSPVMDFSVTEPYL